MGQGVEAEHFRHRNFTSFRGHMQREMQRLLDTFSQNRFSSHQGVAGLELEAWLTNDLGDPIPQNGPFLERLRNPSVVPELSKFNIEFNVDPQPLEGDGLLRVFQELDATWIESNRVAASMGMTVVAIGILPTVEERDLTLATISDQKRYRLLNEQVLRLRQGRPLHLDIASDGHHFKSDHRDVMLEAAATSLQLHLQVPGHSAARYFNAAIVAAAPTVAISANAPCLFGKRLWDETRIPLFEQAVDIDGELPRVTLGTGYAVTSLAQLFVENFENYSVILPFHLEEPIERFPHLRLHNGTIWRWVRPLLGMDDDGTPHLRIEHRVMSAGPTIADMAANSVFFYGLVRALAEADVPPESRLPFELAKQNFYACAHRSLRAEMHWFDQKECNVSQLVRSELIPLARKGLESFGVASEVAEKGLAIIEARLAKERNGAIWQQRFLERYGQDRQQLTQAYRERQLAGEPVHTWEL